MNNQNLKERKEYNLVNGCIDYFNSHGGQLALVEYPIQSVEESQLGKNQSIPDAVVIDRNNTKNFFVEVTHFSRNQEMHSAICKREKKILKDPLSGGPGILDTTDLKASMSLSIAKKASKDYSQFAQIAGIEPLGYLVLGFVNADPFYDISQHNELLCSFDDHVLYSLGLATSCFDCIMLCAYVNVHGDWQIKWEVIADSRMMNQLRNRYQISQEMKSQFNIDEGSL